MTLRPSSAARQDRDVPTTRAGDQPPAEVSGDPPTGRRINLPADPHPAPASGGAGRTRRQRQKRRRSAAGAPQCPETTAPQCPEMTVRQLPDITPDAGASTGSLTPVQKIMHARLQAMAQPRADDNPRLARLRAVFRDRKIMARVVANVDSWPELTAEQWAEAIALLRPRRDF
jgi:hypothetical protein